MVDRIRTEIAAHRADDAIALIGVYQSQFPKGGLAPEAKMLHVRALLDKGDRDGATALGRRLVAADPNGPYAAKIRAMLGGDRP
jgi:TolA-binding protein